MSKIGGDDPLKELKAKPKMTQAMTRDGLTLENQATGEVENISSREAKQDYTPGTGGKAAGTGRRCP